MLLRFVDGLKISAGSAHQLAHAQQNPGWLKVRDLLENLVIQGQTMATAKAIPRQEVLRQLDVRKMNLSKNV